MTRALELLLAQDIGSDEVGRSLWLAASRSTQAIAVELWDADAVHTLATRQLEVAREAGALVQLRLALNFLGGSLVHSGELAMAELLFDEDRLVAEATGNQPVTYSDVAARGLARPGGEGDRAARGHPARGERARDGPVRQRHDLPRVGAQQLPRPIRGGTRCRVAGIRARSRGARADDRAGAGRGSVADR